MAYSVQAKNLMLDYLTSLGLYASAHSADPGSTGANEIAGTTRQALTYAAAAGGSASQTNSPDIPGVPSGTSVAYLGVWKHASSTSTAHYIGKQLVTTFTGTGTPWSYSVAAGTLDLNQLPSA